MVFICCLEATSGKIPPNLACKSTWEATILERIRRPSSTTDAAVSSQDVSIPRIRIGGLSSLDSLRVDVFGIFGSLYDISFTIRFKHFLWVEPNPWGTLPILQFCHPGVRNSYPQGGYPCPYQDNINPVQW